MEAQTAWNQGVKEKTEKFGIKIHTAIIYLQ